jgi:hypothetical protein
MWGEDDNNVTEFSGCKVVEVSMPLIKIAAGEEEKIINTASIAFVQAAPEK